MYSIQDLHKCSSTQAPVIHLNHLPFCSLLPNLPFLSTALISRPGRVAMIPSTTATPAAIPIPIRRRDKILDEPLRDPPQPAGLPGRPLQPDIVDIHADGDDGRPEEESEDQQHPEHDDAARVIQHAQRDVQNGEQDHDREDVGRG